MFGARAKKKETCHVDDLLCMVDAVIRRQTMNYRLYNCGMGTAYSVEEVVRLLIEISGKKLTLVFDETKPTIDFNLVLNFDLAE